jgi:hypothetical protein
MTQFLIFLAAQWPLVGILLALIVLFMWNENRRAGDSISVHQLTYQVNNANALVVDLREPKEFREGHVVDALNIPFAKLAERMRRSRQNTPAGVGRQNWPAQCRCWPQPQAGRFSGDAPDRRHE